MPAGYVTRDAMRAEVADSWHLSAAARVDADSDRAPITLDGSELRDVREAHPLARVFSLRDDVLGQAARDCGPIMAVSDAAGKLLWVSRALPALRAAVELRRASIHDPVSSDLLGVRDVTGGDAIAVPQTMGMVRAAARMAEAELARDLLARLATICRSPGPVSVPEPRRGGGIELLVETSGGTRQWSRSTTGTGAVRPCG